jgi:uncharacterized protein with ParB-like and HNH nuclease domain
LNQDTELEITNSVLAVTGTSATQPVVAMSPITPAVEAVPLVTESTRAQSENIETVLSRMASGRITIPDYQRDSDQWDSRKESLFIESLLNNLTVPAFFFSQIENSSKIEVVDGQQRLTTIQKYANGVLSLSTDDSVVYLTPQAVQYRGKKFNELSERAPVNF